MNSDDLGLFDCVIRAGSISRAALDLGSDQSTVSRRISHLETELGVRLLHRSGRGVTPTEHGRHLLEYATAVANLLQQASADLRSRGGSGPAALSIGAQPTIARVSFGALAHALQGRFPGTRLRFVEALGSQILDRLAGGELDFAVMYLPEQIGQLQFDPLLKEGVHLVVPPGHALQGGAFEVARLGGVPLILPSTHHGLRRLVEALGVRHGFKPDIALECDGSISLTKRLVMQGCGCTVLPLAAVNEDLAAGRLRALRVTGPEIWRTVGLVQGRNRQVPTGLWEVLQIVRAQIERLVESGGWPDTALSGSDAADVAGQAAPAA
ncbi:LysR family transcriptional regulator [Thauera sinica]|uniref:LysR family transcriptional regulator n=1 Tax=Thauera sinica TaxID=2665146 RepID=A0ABW1AMY4_9RHOO|nr:LysR family transcriptional regulator [Thauera sp. K11]ATE61661.1 LysR family transcriptional regulator [Thauera sp. K11]